MEFLQSLFRLTSFEPGAAEEKARFRQVRVDAKGALKFADRGRQFAGFQQRLAEIASRCGNAGKQLRCFARRFERGGNAVRGQERARVRQARKQSATAARNQISQVFCSFIRAIGRNQRFGMFQRIEIRPQACICHC